MKTWSIYTCNKDYFEKKYNHVKNFGDIFKDTWPQIDKLSVCDDDTDLEGLGFIKKGFIFSINWCDYWTKRWICFFLNFGLESFCCDDPKQNCQGDTEFLTKELPDSLPKHSDTILLGILSFFKIIGYGGLNLLYLLILFPVCLSAGYTGSWQSKDDYSILCNNILNKFFEEFPEIPFPFGWMRGLIKAFWKPCGQFGIWVSKFWFFLIYWAMLCCFNYVRILFFMLSGEECGCNLFTKWEKQSNKLILIRIAIPVLIWASIMFSMFMFFQILMLRGITSPEIMHPDMFQEALNYYFMKYNIDTLKEKNMKTDKLTSFYDGNNNYEDNLDLLKNNDYLTNDDESYHLNRLPEILSALQIDLKDTNLKLQNLSQKFKNNQTVLSNTLNHIYGEGLDTIYDKLKKLRTYKSKNKEIVYPWMDLSILKDENFNTDKNKKYITPTIIDKIYELKVLKENKPKSLEEIQSKENEIKKLIKEKEKQYSENIEKICNSGIPKYTPERNEKNNGSIGNFIFKMYEISAKFASMPFNIMDKILQSSIMDLPTMFIDFVFSDAVLNKIFYIPEKLLSW